ncbi:hypothetical protein [Halococcoides cellulosivorans]|uniref:Uncharacterized protein n=1 Tax=Halococcoides cellulosivorans TaxID=1679096 RepID=A0A2R4WXI3_9EURY|nr:hypothetical protein [Halococcoides cellulosivorans]AWB26245.1 hypothetical protein HARCEL1_00170 [Halococcoides cellulosivorans]
MSADRHARWLITALVVIVTVGASGAVATTATTGDGPDANLTSGATYASDTTLAITTNASETTWGIYRLPEGESILTPVGEVSIGADGTAVIDLGALDCPPGSYVVGPSVYHHRHFEDGVARPLGGNQRAAFGVVDQSLDAQIETQRVDGAERRVLTVRSNVATSDIVLASETLSPAQLHAAFGGARTEEGVVLGGEPNRSVVADLAGLEPGRHTIRVTSTVGPATDTAVLVMDPSAGVATYRAIDPPTDALSPSEVMAAQGDYLADEIDLATVVAVLRTYVFG